MTQYAMTEYDVALHEWTCAAHELLRTPNSWYAREKEQTAWDRLARLREVSRGTAPTE